MRAGEKGTSGRGQEGKDACRREREREEEQVVPLPGLRDGWRAASPPRISRGHLTSLLHVGDLIHQAGNARPNMIEINAEWRRRWRGDVEGTAGGKEGGGVGRRLDNCYHRLGFMEGRLPRSGHSSPPGHRPAFINKLWPLWGARWLGSTIPPPLNAMPDSRHQAMDLIIYDDFLSVKK